MKQLIHIRIDFYVNFFLNGIQAFKAKFSSLDINEQTLPWLLNTEDKVFFLILWANL